MAWFAKPRAVFLGAARGAGLAVGGSPVHVQRARALALGEGKLHFLS